jgi:hypothetical protein
VRFAACHSAANTSHAGRADKVCRQLGRVHQLPTRSQNLFALTIGTRNVRGEGSLRGLFERVIFPLGMASPSVLSWNQIAAFLESMRQLRESVGFAA